MTIHIVFRKMKWLKILFEKFNTQQDGGLTENVNKAKRDLEEVQ